MEEVQRGLVFGNRTNVPVAAGVLALVVLVGCPQRPAPPIVTPGGNVIPREHVCPDSACGVLGATFAVPDPPRNIVEVSDLLGMVIDSRQVRGAPIPCMERVRDSEWNRFRLPTEQGGRIHASSIVVSEKDAEAFSQAFLEKLASDVKPLGVRGQQMLEAAARAIHARGRVKFQPFVYVLTPETFAARVAQCGPQKRSSAVVYSIVVLEISEQSRDGLREAIVNASLKSAGPASPPPPGAVTELRPEDSDDVGLDLDTEFVERNRFVDRLVNEAMTTRAVITVGFNLNN
jgi:hypothetical protein